MDIDPRLAAVWGLVVGAALMAIRNWLAFRAAWRKVEAEWRAAEEARSEAEALRATYYTHINGASAAGSAKIAAMKREAEALFLLATVTYREGTP